MKFFVLTLTLLFITKILTAEIIGNLEYQLPERDWKIEFERKKHPTILYVSVDTSAENSKESFYASYINFPGKALNELDSELFLTCVLSFLEVKLNILETTSHSILYEWSAIQNNVEIEHGWAREFSTPKESATLLYRTKNLSAVEQLRPIWIEAFKKAKLK